MPKDKTESHIKIRAAMRAEFLEKGYAGASIRSIGRRAGLTSAALYRHFSSKEEMFCAAVEPLVKEIRDWMQQHKQTKYQMLSAHPDGEALFGESVVDLVREVILPRRDEFLLLVNCAEGTRYEHFIHRFVEENQQDLADAFASLREMGYPAKMLGEEELHMILSAYMTALLEPVIHGCPDDRIAHCLTVVSDFFMPGWKNLMGLQ
ncbi:MAG: TetR/AcrR family transcriptional regulator [Oscillospiraceae bacterium]|nr:TetR/AcrR family transcriptional regulator [Oscillospiraceae bacterium]